MESTATSSHLLSPAFFPDTTPKTDDLHQWKDRDIIALRQSRSKKRISRKVAPRGLPFAMNARGRTRGGIFAGPSAILKSLFSSQSEPTPNDAHESGRPANQNFAVSRKSRRGQITEASTALQTETSREDSPSILTSPPSGDIRANVSSAEVSRKPAIKSSPRSQQLVSNPQRQLPRTDWPQQRPIPRIISTPTTSSTPLSTPSSRQAPMQSPESKSTRSTFGPTPNWVDFGSEKQSSQASQSDRILNTDQVINRSASPSPPSSDGFQSEDVSQKVLPEVISASNRAAAEPIESAQLHSLPVLTPDWRRVVGLSNVASQRLSQRQADTYPTPTKADQTARSVGSIVRRSPLGASLMSTLQTNTRQVPKEVESTSGRITSTNDDISPLWTSISKPSASNTVTGTSINRTPANSPISSQTRPGAVVRHQYNSTPGNSKLADIQHAINERSSWVSSVVQSGLPSQRQALATSRATTRQDFSTSQRSSNNSAVTTPNTPNTPDTTANPTAPGKITNSQFAGSINRSTTPQRSSNNSAATTPDTTANPTAPGNSKLADIQHAINERSSWVSSVVQSGLPSQRQALATSRATTRQDFSTPKRSSNNSAVTTPNIPNTRNTPDTTANPTAPGKITNSQFAGSIARSVSKRQTNNDYVHPVLNGKTAASSPAGFISRSATSRVDPSISTNNNVSTVLGTRAVASDQQPTFGTSRTLYRSLQTPTESPRVIRRREELPVSPTVISPSRNQTSSRSSSSPSGPIMRSPISSPSPTPSNPAVPARQNSNPISPSRNSGMTADQMARLITSGADIGDTTPRVVSTPTTSQSLPSSTQPFNQIIRRQNESKSSTSHEMVRGDTESPERSEGEQPMKTSQMLDLMEWVNRAVDDRLRLELERRGMTGRGW